MPFSRLSWVPFSCTLRRSAEHTSSDCIWGFSQSVPTSDSQVTSASGLSAWCCAGRAENGKIRDWLIRANKIKLHYKKEPAGHLNLITLTCWFLFILHLLYYASSGSLYPAFCIALSKSANVIFSLFIEKSLHISHKIFKIYETPTIITLIIENASIFPRDILETNKPIMLIITEIIR